MTDNEIVDVAVVGGGVSGLSAAYELKKRKRSVVVLERDERPGGVIRTERVGEFVIDAGPDALLVQKPAAVALCNELGLGDRLFPTKLPRTAFILRNGELHPLPGASVL
ncbi:MAG: FAD-dependent oxidoreductase, partial [Acidobacteria bacterium]